jgi:hypothetical protein
MGLSDRMTDTVTVYARTRAADTWTRACGPLPALVTRLNASGQRRESRLPDPDVTHMARLPIDYDGLISAGNRVRRASDAAEWVVKFVRPHYTLAGSHVALGLAEVEATSGS